MSRRRGRVEDRRLLTGAGCFSDDAVPQGALHGHFLRSPHAHARIMTIDHTVAAAMPGVIVVLTAADLRDLGAGSLSHPPPAFGRGGAPLRVPPRPALAAGRVLHVGQPVALIVARSLAAALDAAEAIEVTYEPLPAIVEATAALAPGAPQLWPEAIGNLALDWPGPVQDPDGANAAAVQASLAGAACRVGIALGLPRITAAPLEPRGATAWPETPGFVLRACSQGAAMLRDGVAAAAGLPPGRLRVLTGDVGGAFGMKTPPYPEYVALIAAAARTGQAVHWMATRAEAFLADNQARDAWMEAELALDASGAFLALRVRSVVNLGAFVSSHGAHIATSNFARCVGSLYRVPRIDVGVRLAFTNTLPTGPYRGAGRPEANYLMEQLVEEAARTIGIDSITLRRRNMLRPEEVPYRSPVGTVIDSGDFPAMLEAGLARADAAGFTARRAASAARGRLRGLGLSCFLEHSGALPTESATILFEVAERRCRIRLGVQAAGQGHETVFARLAAERLGLDAGQVIVEQGDSGFGLRGAASVASRSTATAGSAVLAAVDAAIARAHPIAATLLQAPRDRIRFTGCGSAGRSADMGGGFLDVSGAGRVELFAVAAEAARLGTPLDGTETVEVPETFPNGCHIAEVEIDPETGAVQVVRYTAVDDCGNVLDHVLADGQVMGGAMQGIGQALLERVVYDEAGQLLTGGFQDYAMPRAADAPCFGVHSLPSPTATNPLGVKGVGEAGTTAALAAVFNAILDALPHPAAAVLAMPATAEVVWRACRPRAPTR